jgi:hypothetical protein
MFVSVLKNHTAGVINGNEWKANAMTMTNAKPMRQRTVIQKQDVTNSYGDKTNANDLIPLLPTKPQYE